MNNQIIQAKPFWRMYLLHCRTIGATPSDFNNLKNWIEGGRK